MKRTILVIGLLLSGVVMAQSYQGGQSRQQPGQGVTVISSQKGIVMAIGNPVYRQVPSRQCSQEYSNQPTNQQNRNQSGFNVGSVAGTLIGGAIGSQFGRGTGRDVMIAGGAVIGSQIGNNAYQQDSEQVEQRPRNVCQTVYEQQHIGNWVVIKYGNAQLEDIIRREVNVGDTIDVKVRSTVYLEQ